MCEIVTKSGAEFIKNFPPVSPKPERPLEDVKLMKEHVGEGVKVKAAGGISSFADAEEFMRLQAQTAWEPAVS